MKVRSAIITKENGNFVYDDKDYTGDHYIIDYYINDKWYDSGICFSEVQANDLIEYFISEEM